MVGILIWLYILISIFGAGIFLKPPLEMERTIIGIALLISGLLVYSKRRDIAEFLRKKKLS